MQQVLLGLVLLVNGFLSGFGNRGTPRYTTGSYGPKRLVNADVRVVFSFCHRGCVLQLRKPQILMRLCFDLWLCRSKSGRLSPKKMHWFPTRTDYSDGFEGVPNFETRVNREGPFSKSYAPTVHLVTISEALHEPSAMQAGILCDLRDFGWSQDVFNGAVCILQNLTSTIFAT